jgi:hypothetical protein
MNTSSLPVTRNLSQSYKLSLIVAVLMAVLSLAGLLFQSSLYPTEALRRAFVSNNLVNLFIGLPILLGSMRLTQRGRLIGLLFWPGALFYVTYNYVAYSTATLFTFPFVLYLALAALSIYTIFRLLSSLDVAGIQQRLNGTVSERLVGGVLIGFGLLFFLKAIAQVVHILSGQPVSDGPEVATLVTDLLITPFWVAGGVLLWQKQAFGYVSGAGLLFQASMLFAGLLNFFILQPFMNATPFPVKDFVVILIMGLVCFIPFGLFIRGVVTNSKN